MPNLNIYSDQTFFAQEREKIFNTRWLLVCHESELSVKGQYFTFNVGGEPLFIIRSFDNQIRCFFNICVHRGFPLLFEQSGLNKNNSIQCKYHGWKYDSQGTQLPTGLTCKSLQVIEVKKDMGFLFIKIRTSSNDLSLENNRLFQEFNHWSARDLSPVNRNTFSKTLPINWKLFIENTIEGCHVPFVHKTLNSLIGSQYIFETEKSILKTTAPLLNDSSAGWTARTYKSVVKTISKPLLKSANWTFYFLFPNTQITVTDEQVFYLQAIPISESSTLIRGRYLETKDIDRSKKVAQYLSLRLGKQIYREDQFILQRAQVSNYSTEYKYYEQQPSLDPSLTFFKNEYRKAMLKDQPK